jgi:hypothetical protein
MRRSSPHCRIGEPAPAARARCSWRVYISFPGMEFALLLMPEHAPSVRHIGGEMTSHTACFSTISRISFADAN